MDPCKFAREEAFFRGRTPQQIFTRTDDREEDRSCIGYAITRGRGCQKARIHGITHSSLRNKSTEELSLIFAEALCKMHQYQLPIILENMKPTLVSDKHQEDLFSPRNRKGANNQATAITRPIRVTTNISRAPAKKPEPRNIIANKSDFASASVGKMFTFSNTPLLINNSSTSDDESHVKRNRLSASRERSSTVDTQPGPSKTSNAQFSDVLSRRVENFMTDKNSDISFEEQRIFYTEQNGRQTFKESTKRSKINDCPSRGPSRLVENVDVPKVLSNDSENLDLPQRPAEDITKYSKNRNEPLDAPTPNEDEREYEPETKLLHNAAVEEDDGHPESSKNVSSAGYRDTKTRKTTSKREENEKKVSFSHELSQTQQRIDYPFPQQTASEMEYKVQNADEHEHRGCCSQHQHTTNGGFFDNLGDPPPMLRKTLCSVLCCFGWNLNFSLEKTDVLVNRHKNSQYTILVDEQARPSSIQGPLLTRHRPSNSDIVDAGSNHDAESDLEESNMSHSGKSLPVTPQRPSQLRPESSSGDVPGLTPDETPSPKEDTPGPSTPPRLLRTQAYYNVSPLSKKEETIGLNASHSL